MKGLILLYIKLFISILNLDYIFLKKIKIGRHGAMDNIDYALLVFKKHLYYFNYKKNSAILELGPGDSSFTYDISRVLGFKEVHLIDKGFFFDSKKQHDNKNAISTYFKDYISENKILENSNCSLNYSVNGLDSIKKIPSSSIDFLFSHTVLQHISLNQIEAYIKNLSRITKKNSIQSHTIDLKDMINESLNQLKFSNSFWESSLVKKSFFYTNRLRYSDYLFLFKKYNFEIVHEKVNKFNFLPINYNSLDPQFKDYDLDELKISGFDIVLRNVK